jgi:hypothetical protein
VPWKRTRRRLKRGVFHSLVDLQQAINAFIEAHNAKPKPFVWKADPKAIIAAAKRGHPAALRRAPENREEAAALVRRPIPLEDASRIGPAMSPWQPDETSPAVTSRVVV